MLALEIHTLNRFIQAIEKIGGKNLPLIFQLKDDEK
jgi:hypothetical protein